MFLGLSLLAESIKKEEQIKFTTPLIYKHKIWPIAACSAIKLMAGIISRVHPKRQVYFYGTFLAQVTTAIKFDLIISTYI